MKIEPAINKKSKNISSDFLLDAISNYVERENFPKNLVIKKLRLLSERNEEKIKELTKKEKDADKTISIFQEQIQQYRHKNTNRLRKLRTMEQDY